MDLMQHTSDEIEQCRVSGDIDGELELIVSLLDLLMSKDARLDDMFAGQKLLTEYHTVDYLERIPELVGKQIQSISSDVSIRQIGNFNIYPTLVCLAWFLSRDEIAGKIIELTNQLKNLSYYLGAVENRILNHVTAYMDAKVLEPQIFPRMPKIDKPYVYYANLMNAIITGENIDAAIKAVDKNFKERNKDMKADEPAPRVLGTGQAPTKWDIWREAILSYGRRHYNYKD